MDNPIRCPTCEGHGQVPLRTHSPALADALDLVQECGTLTAAELADVLPDTYKNPISTALDRLEKLRAFGFVTRSRVTETRGWVYRIAE